MDPTKKNPYCYISCQNIVLSTIVIASGDGYSDHFHSIADAKSWSCQTIFDTVCYEHSKPQKSSKAQELLASLSDRSISTRQAPSTTEEQTFSVSSRDAEPSETSPIPQSFATVKKPKHWSSINNAKPYSMETTQHIMTIVSFLITKKKIGKREKETHKKQSRL